MSRFIHQCLKPASAVLTLGGVAGGAYAADTTALHQDGVATSDGTHAEQTTAGTSASRAAQDGVQATQVERIHVIGHPFNTMHAGNDMGRLPQDVMHTPQTIDVVPRELIKQQNVKSLDEALRNVPGITASVGEGAGGLNGDQFLIRGFPAQNDIYEDGLRDFGVYSRDSFNYDSVNVIKGPSSQVFGNGTTGGAINVVTKTPTVNDHYNVDFSGGSADYFRGTVDVNKRINDTTAFRLEGLGASNNVVGRDHVWDHRWGIAPSVAFGLGTKTTVVLQVMHETDNSIPDYGMPVVKARGSAYGRPISEYGVPRQNWYGKQQDHNHTDDTMETLRLKHIFNDHLTFHNDLRFGEYSRDFEASKVQCGTKCVNALNSGNYGAGVITRNTNGSVPLPYKQNSWSFQDVASLQADFKTGFLRHQVVTGFDMEYVHDSRHQDTYEGASLTKAVPTANMLYPDPHNVPDAMVRRVSAQANSMPNIAGIGKKPNSRGYGFDTGIFLYDQIWLTNWASIKGGFRWDRWQSNYWTSGLSELPNNPDRSFPQTTNTFNPTASLVLTPTKWQTVYFTYASSTTPTGMYVTSGAIPVRPGSKGTVDTRPQRARLYEVGSKFSLLHDRLGATISLFRLDKSNALTTDPVSNSTINTGAQQRNQGMELSLGGMILPGWNITATYALYDPKTSSNGGGRMHNQIQYVPHNQATLWSAYEAFPGTPWNFTIGGGLTWRQKVYLDNDNTSKVPANVDFDTVISHHFGRHWQVSLNGYNLANRLNYNSLFSGYATPAPGRTFLGRLTMDY
ncbi:TonB-dependent siderophore receptor [Parasaccharibacter sp. TMW 2.1891]|uniref:TonB-dependent receptor n=1 Tax=Parasaccharibacter sp. TMW 2.1891 TaxID=2267836 RepID=UPI002012D35B|nr:TonB-dependent siderophore receptor [Parasaccharibacter sp. TMW 2.1891]MCL1513864.1 TonB-dependent siderophore receptor [Parasaccharibacter sp. TMW 2.1891]